MPNSSGNSSKIDALLKREAALKAAIAIEKVRQQKKDERDEARLHAIIGEALVGNAAQHPDFEMMLKTILKTRKFSDAQKALLQAKGWL